MLLSCSNTQVNLKVWHRSQPSSNENIKIDKIVWYNERINEFQHHLNEEIPLLNFVVDKILSDETNLNTEIENFGDVLYTAVFKVFGDASSRKYNSPWFPRECDVARQQLKAANRAYRKYRSNNCRNIVIEKRKIYCKAERTAKIRYKNEQKRFFSDTAKNNPQKFWDEIRIRYQLKTFLTILRDSIHLKTFIGMRRLKIFYQIRILFVLTLISLIAISALMKLKIRCRIS